MSSLNKKPYIVNGSDQVADYKQKLSILPDIIAHSWERSIASGVDRCAEALPVITDTDKRITRQNISNNLLYYFATYQQYISSLNSLFESLESALLFADSSLHVYDRYGNKQLQQELNKKNVSFGTNFSEDNVGTTALSLAKETRKNVWVHTDQHYCMALADYVCFAAQVKNSLEEEIFIMVIIPKDNYNEAIASVVEHTALAFGLLCDYNIIPSVSTSNQLLDFYMQKNHSSYLIIDEEGHIIKAHSGLLYSCRLSGGQTIGDHILNKLPELKTVMDKVIDGVDVYMDDVSFGNMPFNNRHFFVSTTSLFFDNTKCTAIIFQDKFALSRQMQKVFNNGAFFTLQDIIGESEAIGKLKKQILQSANSSGNVLIIGESGTGKELIAQSIHNMGSRRNQPFISLNCATIPKELISSELFGYTDGSFTGARKGGASGKFEQANGGSLFLDEIGDMPLDMQAALLRVLEDRTITRLGSSKSQQVDVRILAATNRNLLDCVKNNTFRMDLYYRLNVIRIDVAPLRDRMDDIPLLIDHWLTSLSASYGVGPVTIAPETMQYFYRYSWPGNVRELRNLLERIINSLESSVIMPEHLPADFIKACGSATEKTEVILHDPEEISFTSETYDEFEKQNIIKLLRKHKGNKTAAANELNMARQTFYNRLKKHGLS